MGLSWEKSGKQELSDQRSPDRVSDLVKIGFDFHLHLLKKQKKSLDFYFRFSLAEHSVRVNLGIHVKILNNEHFEVLFPIPSEFLIYLQN